MSIETKGKEEELFNNYCDVMLASVGMRDYSKLQLMQHMFQYRQFGSYSHMILPPRKSTLAKIQSEFFDRSHPLVQKLIEGNQGLKSTITFIDEFEFMRNSPLTITADELIQCVHSSEKMNEFCSLMQIRMYHCDENIDIHEFYERFRAGIFKWIECHFYYMYCIYGWRTKNHLHEDVHVKCFNGNLDVVFTYDDLCEHQPKPCWRIVNMDGRPVREIFMGIMI